MNRKFLKYYLPPILYAILIFILSSLPGKSLPKIGSWNYLIHFIEFFILGYLIKRAFFVNIGGRISFFSLFKKNKTRLAIISSRRLITAFSLSIFLGILYAALDEYHQSFISGRVASLSDFLFDSLGIIFGQFLFLSKNRKPKLLLHCCCAGCAVGVIKELKDKFNLTAYFYNPNIHPQEEYNKRLEDMKKICRIFRVPLIVGEYEVDYWFKKVEGCENEPEGGQRCKICYQLRLEKTAELAKSGSFSYFATTLTISPYKKAEIINPLGLALAKKYGIIFYEADFKKRDGFLKSVELSKKYNLYRQNYCGCIYSIKTNKSIYDRRKMARHKSNG